MFQLFIDSFERVVNLGFVFYFLHALSCNVKSQISLVLIRIYLKDGVDGVENQSVSPQQGRNFYNAPSLW